jgi:hypothetical protein
LDSIQKVEAAKEVLLDMLEDEENGDADRAAIEHVLALFPET